ncbi:hypothetical protein [Limosilactobacillus fermentum]|uniref:hypothetical protein n=1 Tax=Limosilactobacillus fermentum TaxID=1613 RepID=UPI00124437C2|nr:hypothetical protein [Limosilactobacillus fermentum]QEY01751.1 hypothetical protein F4U91_09880 [Limosilactobacillus fermentum]
MIFFDSQPSDSNDYVQVIGRLDNQRVTKWIRTDYLKVPDNFYKYKVFVPAANGSGELGETLSTPLIGRTELFISIGSFDTELEAQNLLKYVKTKFARGMLGVLKVTQHNPPAKWAKVPLEDFTEHSDVDWSVPIGKIDEQLYRKYGFNQKQIDFFEEKVQEMK